MSSEARRDGRGRRLRIAAKMALAAIAVGFVALWFAFQHKPGWYRPAALDEAMLRRARSESVATADYVGDRLVERETFEVTLSDRAVNEWLAAMPELWPEARQAWPPELTEPAVRFDHGSIRLGGNIEYRGWRAIVAVGLTLTVAEDGRSIAVRLDGASGGSLPAPRAVLERWIDPELARLARRSAERGRSGEGLDSVLSQARSIGDLYAGVSVRNRFVWFNGHRPFRIGAIEVREGELKLRIEPL